MRRAANAPDIGSAMRSIGSWIGRKRAKSMNDKCDASCPKRRVGCRTGCEIWEKHEAKKERRYAAKKVANDTDYVSPMAVAGAKQKVKDYKSGRGR